MTLQAAPRERRVARRVECPGRVELQTPHRSGLVSADSVNLSEDGVCIRVQEFLEVRSPVSLRLFAHRRQALECQGRIAWITQRLDLRDAPPFVYDVGVEFTRTPNRLRQWLSPAGPSARKPPAPPARSAARPELESVLINGRLYAPQLTREAGTPSSWHLVVLADGAPCFSRRYPSMLEALGAWTVAKREFQRSVSAQARA